VAKINDIEVDDYLSNCVIIEPLAIEEEFIRLPADLAYWNERFAQANRAFLIADIEEKRTEARLHLECRARLTVEKGEDGKKVKAPTVSDIEAEVNGHEDMQRAQDRLIAAEAEKVRLYGVLDAIRTKREMVVSLGAHMRAEMQGDPTLREQALSARRIRESGQ